MPRRAAQIRPNRALEVKGVVGLGQVGEQQIARMGVELSAVGQNKAPGLDLGVVRKAVLHPPVEHGLAVAVAKGCPLKLEEVGHLGVKHRARKGQTGQGHVEIVAAAALFRGQKRVAALDEAVDVERIAVVLAADVKAAVVHIAGLQAVAAQRLGLAIAVLDLFFASRLLFALKLKQPFFHQLHDPTLLGQLLAQLADVVGRYPAWGPTQCAKGAADSDNQSLPCVCLHKSLPFQS